MTTATTTREMGAISALEVYPRSLFIRKAGLTQSSFAALVRAGLRVSRIGKRSLVRGGAFLEFCQSQEAPR